MDNQAKKALEAIWHRIRPYREIVFTAAGLLAASVVFGAYFIVATGKAQNKALIDLAYAQGYASNGMNDKALEIVEIILKRRLSASIAQQARILKADIFFSMKRYAEARDVYQEIVQARKPRNLIPFGYIGLGASLENLRDYDKAVNALTGFIALQPEHYLVPNAYDSLARMYVNQNNAGKAKETYDKIVTLYPNTAWAQSAQEKLNEMSVRPDMQQVK